MGWGVLMMDGALVMDGAARVGDIRQQILKSPMDSDLL
jgi:hypothetical protein